MLNRSLTLLFISLGFAASSMFAQNESPSRSITSEGFRSQRPTESDAGAPGKKPVAGASVSKKNADVISSPKRKYSYVTRVSAPRLSAAAVGKPGAMPPATLTPAQTKTVAPVLMSEELGVTFWRLRVVKDTDGDVPTFPVIVGDGTQKWAAERVKSSTRFQPGDRVRFTIEASRTGYLYIANREVYADGSTGDAEIIFPTLRTRSGDNHVSAGTLVEIPASTDSVPYFTIQPRRANYAGEELIVVITPNELADIEKSLRPAQISRDRLAEWYKWQMGEDVYDADDGEGIAYTRVEADAAESTSRSLTREEPLPQTIYRVRISKETPLFVIIRLDAAKQ
jgi:hypothetical protein